jgi:hypothetical protein
MAKDFAGLAMTAEDHKARGSTPPQVLIDNPGKKLHETMDEKELRYFMADQYMVVTAQHRRALGGDPREIQILGTVRDGFLVPNLIYLKEIGRLPEELEDIDPTTAFALPSP